ncbi:MAG: M23 family metallopeptidase [Gammaproteobacteria bacterium]
MGIDRKSARRGTSSRLATVCKLLFIGVLVGCGASSTNASPTQVQTPLILSVHDAPVPFKGSDGKTHLVYELWVTNFSSAQITVTQAEVFGDGQPLETLGTSQIAQRLQPVGNADRSTSAIMQPGTVSLLFLHLILPDGTAVPQKLSQEIAFSAVGRDQQFMEHGGTIKVDFRPPLIIGPPLMGANLISADSCCDAIRHTRAALPINGRVWLAQRYAVDWEQLDDHNRVYSGPRDDVHSYTIYGDNVYAVADGKVVLAINDQPDQVPGQPPSGITLDNADGNAVIEDLGNGSYALYAHLVPGSVTVHVGDTVTRGEIIGKVGNSGNSIAPHLHFHVTNGPLPLASNGLPYEIDSYQLTAISPSTEAFDEAEANGTPLDVMPVDPPAAVTNALPLDQLVFTLGPPSTR